MEYVKYISQSRVEFAPRNFIAPGITILNFRNLPEKMREYGYKPLIEAEKDYERPFHIEYEEFEDEIREVIVYDPLVDDGIAADTGGDTAPDPELFEQGGDVNG